MAVIDPAGLSGGKRLRRCSDRARLLWPYLFVHSNNYGRFEIDLARIVAVVFLGFKQPPTAGELAAVIHEYAQNDLLFVYSGPDGSRWGQWAAKDSSFGRYKTAADQRSPAPSGAEFVAWKRRVNSGTQVVDQAGFTNSQAPRADVPGQAEAVENTGFPKSSQGLGPAGEAPKQPSDGNKGLPKFSENLRIGVGVGVGIGSSAGGSTGGEPGSWRWYAKLFPGQIDSETNGWDCQVFLSSVLTDMDKSMLTKNLPLWIEHWERNPGFTPSSENFLRKGRFRSAPQQQAKGTKPPEWKGFGG